jgi:hypothetical protein
MIHQLNPPIQISTPSGPATVLSLIYDGEKVLWVCDGMIHFESRTPEMTPRWKKAPKDSYVISTDHSDKWAKVPKFEDQFKVVPVEGMPDDSIRLDNGWWVKKAEAEKAKKMADDFWAGYFDKVFSPAGKWQEESLEGKELPPMYQEWNKKQWERIVNDFNVITIDTWITFVDFLDKHYTPPSLYNFKTWDKVGDWSMSLAEYKDEPLLTFLIKFYPAPVLKK